MSWIWGNETTEQAQIVVSALQTELDAREDKIQALEAALRREQHAFTQSVEGELAELDARRQRLEQELQEVSALIRDKQALIKKAAAGPAKPSAAKKKKKKKTATATTATTTTTSSSTPTTAAGATTTEAGATTTTEDAGAEGDAVATPKGTAKKKKTKKAAAAPVAALPMSPELAKVAKVAPTVAFIIQRSTNANTVVYAGNIGANGKLDATKPMDVYWIMYEKSGAPREDLNMIERNTAYGVSCSPLAGSRDRFNASLASLKDRDCVLFLDTQGFVHAHTTINGRPDMLLRRVFVQMTSSWGIPAVDYIEIFGVDPTTLEPVYEKKLNK